MDFKPMKYLLVQIWVAHIIPFFLLRGKDMYPDYEND